MIVFTAARLHGPDMSLFRLRLNDGPVRLRCRVMGMSRAVNNTYSRQALLIPAAIRH
ncbi:hypothetical protein CHELA20_11581 [Hyphomicrobiales bacterium]|nr:hypothetical protein CHELA20_11581 [Hyphomicrobiales bacterium]CAH1689095.1 hypothetical protein CHELA41_50034 [Hyphomicrobiales bacterium]